MRIEDFLEDKKNDIIERWFQVVVGTYSNDTAHFLKNQKDPFTNPVGSNILSGLKALLDDFINGTNEKAVKDFLDPIVRIRAIQTIFSPSQAIAFIFDLKTIIRDILKKELNDRETLHSLMLFETKIDKLALTAFDMFVECREKIYEIKTNQERNKVYRAFERAGLIAEVQES